MSKLLVVFGATGQQGGSVIDYVLNDPGLSKQYQLRGITRNTSSSAAQALQAKGVEVVVADAEQPETLKDAVRAGHTVFSNTATVYDEKLYDREISSGKAIADASVAAGVQYIIYSSSTPAGTSTGRPVPAFDSKYVVEEYIRTLPIKSAFYVPGSFLQNLSGPQKPRPTGEPGVYAINNIISPTTQIPWIDIVADSGKFVGAVLAEPEKYESKDLYAASHMLTLPEVAEKMSQATGKTIKYICHAEETYRNFLPEVMQEKLCAMYAYLSEPGYYGPETKERVAWTQAQARGNLTAFEDYLQANPISLD